MKLFIKFNQLNKDLVIDMPFDENDFNEQKAIDFESDMVTLTLFKVDAEWETLGSHEEGYNKVVLDNDYTLTIFENSDESVGLFGKKYRVDTPFDDSTSEEELNYTKNVILERYKQELEDEELTAMYNFQIKRWTTPCKRDSYNYFGIDIE